MSIIRNSSEVAYQLLDIFLLFGAPHILQSDNGREFTTNIIKELKDMWVDCTTVHGKPRHPQSQGSVERGNADIKDMLVIWMRENNSKKWNIGLKFVQFEKNSHHSGINRSPYKAMFGCDAKIGLSSSSLPQEILGSLQTEEDLIQHFQSSDKPDEISNDKPNELSSDKPNEPDERSSLQILRSPLLKASFCKCIYMSAIIVGFDRSAYFLLSNRSTIKKTT
ncbi:SCAN domain-containing protein 3,KRAB-A domain-containing protein 2 [Mytilus coruscus]|uniref:SCAN domain-containing protein 3,KRAB-A domain-containing protein 2 n=1 Tax=Mytilus coruscus TaxID=42192 RepID=A0A6J8EMU0_MYTCO|nr:SCAN domain-containing protein 3,KRAB-A domain-containing protein 2 [Mytilus coruscus]